MSVVREKLRMMNAVHLIDPGNVRRQIECGRRRADQTHLPPDDLKPGQTVAAMVRFGAQVHRLGTSHDGRSRSGGSTPPGLIRDTRRHRSGKRVETCPDCSLLVNRSPFEPGLSHADLTELPQGEPEQRSLPQSRNRRTAESVQVAITTSNRRKSDTLRHSAAAQSSLHTECKP